LRQSKHELSKIDFEILFTNKTPSDCQPALVEQKKRPRVNAGLKRAVEAGKTLGRPRISVAVEKRIQTQLRAGKGIIKVAREVGAGTGTVQRATREMPHPFETAAA
jgi:DNA invertase Pin-like site-specific DNA recombinase